MRIFYNCPYPHQCSPGVLFFNMGFWVGVNSKNPLKSGLFQQKVGVSSRKPPKTRLFTLPGALFKSGAALARIRYSYIPTCVKTFLKQKKCHTDGFFLLNECYGWSSIKSQSLFIRKWVSTSIFWMYVSDFLCVQSIGAPFRNESFKLDEKWLREMLQMLYFWSTNIQAFFHYFCLIMSLSQKISCFI